MSSSSQIKLSSFSIGDILVSKSMDSGCSKFCQFGIITKITPKGKYRVNFLESINVKDSPHNYHNEHFNTFTEIKPADVYTDESLLCSIEIDEDDKDIYLYTGNKNTSFNYWVKYNPKEVYGNYTDMGD